MIKIRTALLLALIWAAPILTGCSATPVDVFNEADGQTDAAGNVDPLSAMVDRAAAAVDIYYVFGQQAEAILGSGLTPQPIGRAILVADEKIVNVVLRLEPLVLEANSMLLETGVGADRGERYQYLVCNIPQLTDVVAGGLPELKTALIAGGKGEGVIPPAVLQMSGALIGGLCTQ